MRDPNWVALTDAQRGQLVAMWVLAADRDGVIPASPAVIRKLCYMDTEPDLETFTALGFLEPRRQGDASVTPGRRTKARSREAEAEAEAEADTRHLSAASTRARAREEPPDEHFGTLDPLAVSSIKGLYGWPPEGREGTDERVWNGTAAPDRVRCLSIAVARLEGEGRQYQGRLFRRILETVIGEQTGESHDPSIWEDD
jgi:hypothetical protein